MNDTPEQIIRSAFYQGIGGLVAAGIPPYKIDQAVARIKVELADAGMLSEGAPSEAQVEQALDAISRFNQWTDNPRGAMRAALVAAGVAPQAESEYEHLLKARALHQTNAGLPSSGVDEDALANLIHSTSVAHFGGLDPRVAPIIARAVAEFLKGEER